jgi:hypothetical protein
VVPPVRVGHHHPHLSRGVRRAAAPAPTMAPLRTAAATAAAQTATPERAARAARATERQGLLQGLLQGRDVASTSSATSIVPMRCAHKKTRTKGYDPPKNPKNQP